METVYLVIDTETTGSNPFKGDRIVEIAAIPIYKGRIMMDLAYHSLVNPQVVIPAYISGIHGLNNNDVSNQPSMLDVFPKFKEYVGSSIIVGHGVSSDMTFFDMAAKETGFPPINNYYIDTLHLAKALFMEGPYTLQNIAKNLRINDVPTHRAFDDARVTAKVFLSLTRKLGGFQGVRHYEKFWRG